LRSNFRRSGESSEVFDFVYTLHMRRGGRRKINGSVVRRLRGLWSEDYADCGQKTTANYV
jgi:hypothetical protein